MQTTSPNSKTDKLLRVALPWLSGSRSAQRVGSIPDLCPIICLSATVLDEILEYSDDSPNVETGGFLLGRRCHDFRYRRDFLTIHEFLPAASTTGGIDSLTFTHETWSHLHDTIEHQFPDLEILGWHHTHPGFGIFLSRHDEFIHRHFFDSRWHIAMVVDPRNGEFGFFQWFRDELDNTGFLLVPHSGKLPAKSA